MNDTVGVIETALFDALKSTRRPPSARDTFWASGFGMCSRKQIAERAGMSPTNPPDMRSFFKMEVGTTLGKRVQELLTTQGYLHPDFTEKKYVYRSYVCRLDGYSDFDQAVVEIKTCDDSAITRYDEVPEHYKWQCLLNAKAAGVKKVVLFQLGKNQGLTRTRELFLDAEWEQKIDEEIDRMEALWAAFQTTGTLPDHAHRFSWENKLCAFADPASAATAASATRRTRT